MACFAYNETAEALRNFSFKKTDQPVVQVGGVDLLFGSGPIQFSHSGSPVFNVKSEMDFYFERGSFLRFRAEAGVAALSYTKEESGALDSRIAPNVKIMGGLRFNLNSYRTLLVFLIGLGAYYYPEYGISPSGVLDARISHYLTPKIAISGIIRGGHLSLNKEDMDGCALFGAGISYMF